MLRKFSAKQITLAVCALVLLVLVPFVLEDVSSTEYKIKQAAVFGTLSCHSEPGTFSKCSDLLKPLNVRVPSTFPRRTSMEET